MISLRSARVVGRSLYQTASPLIPRRSENRFAVGTFNRGRSESGVRVEVPHRYLDLERSTCHICTGGSFHRGLTRNNAVARTTAFALEHPRSSAVQSVHP